MEALDAFVVSHQEQLEDDNQLREWELAMALGSVHEKVCHSINIFNGVPVVPMSLSTKESRGLLAKLKDASLARVYSLHRMIMVMYTPSVLRTASGSLSLRLLNLDSGETVSVASEHPVSQAAVFVCRWPRAVLAQSSGLALLTAVEGVTTKRGSLVGVLTPFWEDKMSTKMVYEKELPSLMYPLEEQEPAFYVKNMHHLRAVVASKVHLGGRGNDVGAQPIILANGSRPVTTPALTGPVVASSGSKQPGQSKRNKGKSAAGQPNLRQSVLTDGETSVGTVELPCSLK